MTTTQKTRDSDKIQTLNEIVCMKVDEFVSELDIKLFKSGNKLVGPCPVHDGRRYSSFNFWPEGYTAPGYWKCRSHHCEEIFKRSAIGLVRGVLSQRQYNWQKKGDKIASFEEAIHWCCNFIGQDLNSIKIDKEELDRRRFSSQMETINKGKQEKPVGVPKHLVQSSLNIPATFFVDRAYTPDILKRFDVGLCEKPGKEMSGRVVVPVYDERTGMMIGCTGRSIYGRCPSCESFHNPSENCPDEFNRWLFSKWKNSENFNTGSCLYNFWNAKKHIKETGVVILVEGPPDVWRLEEADIKNAVGLFGCELTDEQQVLLETSGAMSVVIMLDNDDAGKEGAAKIKQALSKTCNMYTIDYPAKDVGEMSVNAIRESILPKLQIIIDKNKGYV